MSQSTARIQMLSHQLSKSCENLPCSPEISWHTPRPRFFPSHFTSYTLTSIFPKATFLALVECSELEFISRKILQNRTSMFGASAVERAVKSIAIKVATNVKGK